ncbi:hypothetical protein HYU92_00560 [Candidatus Curtissbacteria bacterium]|nr:hypothetical protein [Candidatus Curtissbacteria bacterium]
MKRKRKEKNKDMTPTTVSFTNPLYEATPFIWVNLDDTETVVEPVDEVIEKLAQNSSFISYLNRIDEYLVKNPTKGVGLSQKYSKFLAK